MEENNEPEPNWWIGIAFVVVQLVIGGTGYLVADLAGVHDYVPLFFWLVFLIGVLELVPVSIFVYLDRRYITRTTEWRPSALYHVPSLLVLLSLTGNYAFSGGGMGREALAWWVASRSIWITIGLAILVNIVYLTNRALVMVADVEIRWFSHARRVMLILVVLLVAWNLVDPAFAGPAPEPNYVSPENAVRTSFDRLDHVNYRYERKEEGLLGHSSTTWVDNRDDELLVRHGSGADFNREYRNHFVVWLKNSSGSVVSRYSPYFTSQWNLGDGWSGFRDASYHVNNSSAAVVSVNFTEWTPWGRRNDSMIVTLNKESGYPSKVVVGNQRGVVYKVYDVGETKVRRPDWAPVLPEELLLDVLGNT